MRTAHEGEALTAREIEVLRMIAGGLQRDTVAIALAISPETVKSYLRLIHAKLGVYSSTHAVHEAWKRGILP